MQNLTFTGREIIGRASCERSEYLKKAYLTAPLMIDIEYIRHYTKAFQEVADADALWRRAASHAAAIENMTPVIHAGETIAGHKTRYIRGAIPYANYAAMPFLRGMRNEAQDAQQHTMEQAEGGGIAAAKSLAAQSGMRFFSGKFLISEEDFSELKTICEYWEGKSFMDRADALWHKYFSQAEFIDNGWKIGLFTAPHEPCPEGRLVLDYKTALAKGYKQIIAEITAKLSDFIPESPDDGQRLLFWQAAKRTLEASLVFAERYANEATRLASKESDPARKKQLLEIASVCRRVPAEPPQNFTEAVQSFWFTYLLGHLEGSHLGYSPGRLDALLFPYYEKDHIPFAEAVAKFEELFVKMTRFEYVASLSWQGLGHGNLYQNLILGGVNAQGLPADNEISLAILQAQINLQLTQPTLSVWYHKSLSEKFLLKAAECVKTGCGYPAFFNQEVYIKHEQGITDFPIEKLRENAAIGGCTEPTLTGMSYGIVQAGFINHGKLLDLALNAGVDPITGTRMFEAAEITTYADFENYYKKIMEQTIHNWQRYWNFTMVAHRQTVPLVFCSVFVNNCLASGLCMDDGGALHNQAPTTLSSGLVNVANSFAVVKKLCFEDKVCSFKELQTAVAANWKSHDTLHKKAMQVPHWGNDNEYVDSIYLDLFDHYCQVVRKQKNYLGKPYDPSMLAISTPVPFGKVCAAFPDGRFQGEPLADGVTSPFPGTDKNGPTAVLRSSLKIDHTQIRGGLLNLKFHPTALHGEEGSRNLLALIKTYFSGPAFHVQFNVVDSKMLREAQRNPEQFRDLVVRVAGFSAYWVEMSRDLQEQVIWRTEHLL